MFPTHVSSFSELLSTNQILVYVVISLVNGLILFLSSMKFLLVLQQCGYHGTRYFKWLGNKDTPYLRRLMLLCLLAFLFFCVLNMCFEPIVQPTIASYVGICSYLLFSITYIKTESKINAKVPLKKTKRLVRLCITYVVFLSAVTFGLIMLVNFLSFKIGDEVVALLRLSLLCGLPILTPYILFLAYCFNEPYEEVSRRRYLRLANRKLNSTNVLKIGITGSYAKTSVKEILRTVLSQKYRVLATPESYNTPLGIALTVKNLDSSHDVFIAEMGARSKGDIKELASLVKPKFGVLTGINNQHLETFGSIETTKDTKFELFEYLGKDGVGFFSSDNVNTVELFERYDGEKYLAGVAENDNFVTATDIKLDARGMSFTLIIKGERPVKCNTVLLGTHSVKNICLASAVAYKIGLTPKEIAQGINRIQSIGHRLELMPNNKNIVIIDDSYNSNVDGINAAMEVLDTFKGRKIVLTPGLVELGKIENVANLEFGKTLAKHADIVIVIGVHNGVMLINGLLEGGMDRENIKFAKTLNKGNEILNEIMQEGDVVLFENDLPDNYN
ncbi:MAG: UDP-N-acetylmuramoyl-tripeptide--D-alanyl-D-alanine ligase [Clostridia bacterium]|nr:UDP-N-acetylmuramoyl-tripeptide--D-alanyl-D-alanine ligase [Clostridia bacterium]